jgi:hypothetical protein
MAQPETRSLIDATTAAWRVAGEAGDAPAAAACCAEDVRIISPLTAAFDFHGRRQAHDMLVAAFSVFSDVRYHTEVGDDANRALFLTGRVRREPFEESQLLRFDAAGLIAELTLFARPIPAATAAMVEIGDALVRGQGRPGLARVIRAAATPLYLGARLGERRLVPLADPNRRVANGAAPLSERGRE